MDTYYYNCHIDASMVDNNAVLRIDKLFDIIMVMVTEYLKQYNMDNVALKKNFNAAWLITKVLFKINKLPNWGNNIKLKSHVILKRPAKIILETIAMDENNNVLFSGIDEMCPINLERRKIIRLSDINYDPIILDSITNESFNNFSLDNLKLIDTINVKYNDIDFTNHTNNVSYIRFITNELGLDFFNNYEIKKLEAKYLNESRINDELNIYCNNQNKESTLLIKKNDDNIFSIKINYVKK